MKQLFSLGMVRLSLGLILALAIGGCATSRQVAQKESKAKKQIFVAPFEQTWQAAVDAVYANKLSVLTTNLNHVNPV